MSFTSIPFAVFTPLFLLAYYAAHSAWRPPLVALASLIFYTWYNAAYLPLLLASALIDYVAALRILASSDQRRRKAWLLASITLNLGILFFFKYWNFFAENVEAVTGTEIVLHHLILPLGISFYTLQTLSYTFDTYRGKLTPERSFFTYFLYVSFFPQLVAGPIERAGRLLPQLRNLTLPTAAEAEAGMVLIAWGVFAKLAVADNLAGFVWSALWGETGGLLLWPIGFCAAAQVYADFLAYTLIARGLARMMGVKLSENFRQPFFARNLNGFWQRWHISLTRWVTDYIHIPLARRHPDEPWRSFIAIMALCIIGLWHGASWNFLFFGLTQGLVMRGWQPVASLGARLNPPAAVATLVSHTAMVAVISFSAPMFFLTDTHQLVTQLGSMFSLDLGLSILANGVYRENFAVGVMLLTLMLINDWRASRGARWHVETIAAHPVGRPILIAVLITLTILLGNFNPQEFIYFDF
ncbi:MBOAT family O-acyltransferase [Litorisediminicola beolgyonensis]|uniref:Probable alginate O-acetylase AlgI n=1 Tax=Litorisediminicola beolgyonensis TaxID=1173614 RepID=A0ABW3ZKH6_9RHOB